jgi:hypothetical protein
MVGRAQISGDELNLLARGYLFAREGVLVPYGNPMSGGGKLPGSLTSLMVGLPLTVWFDYRAPQLLIWALGAVAYLLLDFVLKPFLSIRGRIAFCLLYWLSPWRVYHASFLWNPSYLYFFAALHLWSSIRQREKPNFAFSLLHLLSLGFAAQLHGSAFVLGLHTALLWWFGYLKIHWRGAILGIALVLLSLLPWAYAVMADPNLLPASKEGRFLGRGLLYVYPFFRGILFFIRLPTFFPSARVYRFDFRDSLGETADAILTPFFKILGNTVGIATMAVTILGLLWFLRQTPIRSYFSRKLSADWLSAYCVLGGAAALFSFAISPTGINAWQVLVLHQIAAIPVALYVNQWRPASERQMRWIRRTIPCLIVAGCLVLVAIGAASSQYRRGGRGTRGLPLRNHHPMLEELHLLRDFDLVVKDDGTGWWVDVLPDHRPPPGGADAWVGKPWKDPNWLQ